MAICGPRLRLRGWPAATWFGGPPRRGFFIRLISCSLFPRTSPWVRRRPPRRRRCPTSLRFLNSQRVSGKEQTVLTLFPGSFSPPGHPVCDGHFASPAKKSSKGHAFAVRPPPDPSLVFPSSIFFTNIFTKPFHLFRPFSPFSPWHSFRVLHRSLPVPQTSSGPAPGA